VAQTRCWKPLLGLTRHDKQRNTGIRQKLQVPCIVEQILHYQRKCRRHVARTAEDLFPGFKVSPEHKSWCGVTKTEMEKPGLYSRSRGTDLNGHKFNRLWWIWWWLWRWWWWRVNNVRCRGPHSNRKLTRRGSNFCLSLERPVSCTGVATTCGILGSHKDRHEDTVHSPYGALSIGK
jgi:hypothetical protein